MIFFDIIFCIIFFVSGIAIIGWYFSCDFYDNYLSNDDESIGMYFTLVICGIIDQIIIRYFDLPIVHYVTLAIYTWSFAVVLFMFLAAGRSYIREKRGK